MEHVCPVCNNSFDSEENAPCPFCGFKFAGATEAFKPIAIDAGEAEPKPSLTAKVSLQVMRGPQTGLVFPLEGQRFSLGRSPHCDIFLNDMTVSRDHATIERRDDGSYSIRDNHSYNGLWVNNEMCESACLHAGDFIQIGSFCLLFQAQ